MVLNDLFVDGKIYFKKDFYNVYFKNISPMLETYRGIVYPWECDMFNHMNVQFYVSKFDIASWQLLGQIGITNEYFSQENRGMVTMEQHIKYQRELVDGDLLIIRSTLEDIRDKSIQFRHKMYNSIKNELAAEAVLTSIHLNTMTRKSCNFPAEIKAKFQIALNKK